MIKEILKDVEMKLITNSNFSIQIVSSQPLLL